MLDLFPENNTNWKLFITFPSDTEDYNTFMKRLESSNEAFKWSDVTDTSDNFANNMEDADALIVLSGLWDNYKNEITDHIRYAKTFEKPIVIIRPYGAEEIPEDLRDVATRVVGWNTACIVDAVLQSINGEDYEFLC